MIFKLTNKEEEIMRVLWHLKKGLSHGYAFSEAITFYFIFVLYEKTIFQGIS